MHSNPFTQVPSACIMSFLLPSCGMSPNWLLLMASVLAVFRMEAADFTPGAQEFLQEGAVRAQEGLPPGAAQCMDIGPDGVVQVFASGRWFERRNDGWFEKSALNPAAPNEFVFADSNGQAVSVAVSWREVTQLLRWGGTNFVVTRADPFVVAGGKLSSM